MSFVPWYNSVSIYFHHTVEIHLYDSVHTCKYIRIIQIRPVHPTIPSTGILEAQTRSGARRKSADWAVGLTTSIPVLHCLIAFLGGPVRRCLDWWFRGCGDDTTKRFSDVVESGLLVLISLRLVFATVQWLLPWQVFSLIVVKYSTGICYV